MALLPSQIARLVLGYLKDSNLRAFEVFLKTCPLIKECIPSILNGEFYILKHARLDLLDILKEYSQLISLIEEHFDDSNYEHSISQLTTADKLLYLLNAQAVSSRSNNVSNKLETSSLQTSINKSSSKRKSAPKVGKNTTFDYTEYLTSEENEAITNFVENLLCEPEYHQAQCQKLIDISTNLSIECDKEGENSEIPIKQRLRGAKSTPNKSSKHNSLASDDAIAEQNEEAIHSIMKVCQSTETVEVQTVNSIRSDPQSLPPPLMSSSIQNAVLTSTVSSQTNAQPSTSDIPSFDGTLNMSNVGIANQAVSNIAGYLFHAPMLQHIPTVPRLPDAAGNKQQQQQHQQQMTLNCMTTTDLNFSQVSIPHAAMQQETSSLQYSNAALNQSDIFNQPLIFCETPQQAAAAAASSSSLFVSKQAPPPPSSTPISGKLHAIAPKTTDSKPLINVTQHIILPAKSYASATVIGNTVPNKDIQNCVDKSSSSQCCVVQTPDIEAAVEKLRSSASQQQAAAAGAAPSSSGKSHIRALDFSNNDFSRTLIETSNIKVSVCADVPIATRSPAAKLSDCWDKVQGAGLILGESPQKTCAVESVEIKSKSATATEKKKGQAEWDAHLRALVSKDNTNRRVSPHKPFKKRKKITNKSPRQTDETDTNNDTSNANLDATGQDALQDASSKETACNKESTDVKKPAADEEPTKVAVEVPKSCTKRRRITKIASVATIVRKKSTHEQQVEEGSENATAADESSKANNVEEKCANEANAATAESETVSAAAVDTVDCAEKPAPAKQVKIRRKCNIDNPGKKMQHVQLKKETPAAAASKGKDMRHFDDADPDESIKYVTPDVPKAGVEHPAPNVARRDISSILNSPSPSAVTPCKLDESMFPNTPFLAKFLEETIVPDTSMLTPSVPFSSGLGMSSLSLSTTPAYANRRTDYSTGSSYYQPSEPEQNRSIEQMMEECKRAETTKPSEPASHSVAPPTGGATAAAQSEAAEGANAAPSVGAKNDDLSYVLHEISLPEFEKNSGKELDTSRYRALQESEQVAAEEHAAPVVRLEERKGVIATSVPPVLPDDDDLHLQLDDSSSSSSSSNSSSSSSSDSDTSDSDFELDNAKNTTVINTKNVVKVDKSPAPTVPSAKTKARVPKSIPHVHDTVRKELEEKRLRTISKMRDAAPGSSVAPPPRRRSHRKILPRPANARRMPARDCKSAIKGSNSTKNDDSVSSLCHELLKESGRTQPQVIIEPLELSAESMVLSKSIEKLSGTGSIKTGIIAKCDKSDKSSPIKSTKQDSVTLDKPNSVSLDKQNSVSLDKQTEPKALQICGKISSDKLISSGVTVTELKSADLGKENASESSVSKTAAKSKRKSESPKKFPPMKKPPVASKDINIMHQLHAEAEVATLHLSSDDDMDDDILAPFEVVETELLETSSTSTPLPSSSKARNSAKAAADDCTAVEKLYCNTFEDILKNKASDKFIVIDGGKMACDDARANTLVKDLLERGIHLMPAKKTPKKTEAVVAQVAASKTSFTTPPPAPISSSLEEGEIDSDDEVLARLQPSSRAAPEASKAKKEKFSNADARNRMVQKLIKSRMSEFKKTPRRKSSGGRKNVQRTPKRSSSSGSNVKKRKENPTKSVNRKHKQSNAKAADDEERRHALQNAVIKSKAKTEAISDKKEPPPIRLLIAEMLQMQECVSNSQQSSAAVDSCRDGFSTVHSAEGSDNYFSFEYDENDCCKKTMADYDLELLTKNISAKVYIDDTDTEVDKVMRWTPFVPLFEMKRDDPNPYPSVLGDLYKADDVLTERRMSYSAGHKSRKDQEQQRRVANVARSSSSPPPPSSKHRRRRSTSKRRKSESSKSPSAKSAGSPVRSSNAAAAPRCGEAGLHIENGEIILSSKAHGGGSAGREECPPLSQEEEEDSLMTFAIIGSDRNEHSDGTSSQLSTCKSSSAASTVVASTSCGASKKRKAPTLESTKPEKMPKKEARKLLEGLNLDKFLNKLHSGKN